MASNKNWDQVELWVRNGWQAISLDEALRLDKDRKKRCPECHGQVRVHAAGTNGQAAHFEHYENNPGCRFGHNFDGTKRMHRKRLS
ncbi:hypothetical protein [Bradyrhizobium sp. Arg816]|uniref:hypothetical protein n=1 Tax=Bradyrhizobium sp. Arg816 TaxID=2998491 RepID=UPI00249E6422|nr:hypothetical protein [Bradyrhizobium sp. Arg816]MDI3562539.1 hypothetical protein [Bradyrhizobium sp. Arg816]